MKLTYIGPYDAVEIADTGQLATRGETIEVAGAVGERLLAQPDNWASAGQDPAHRTIDEVLDWVDSDPGRARQALEFEHDRPKPRKRLITDLEAIVEATSEQEARPAGEEG